MGILESVVALVVAVVMFMGLGGALKKQRQEKRSVDDVFARARGLGWQVERSLGTARWRLRGGTPGPSAWTIDYDGDALSSRPVPKLTWRAPALGSATHTFSTAPVDAIRAPGAPSSLSGDLLHAMQLPFGSASAKDYRELLALGLSAEPRNPQLAGQFVILCRDRASTVQAFDDAVENLMVGLPRAGRIAIARHPDALEIAFHGPDPEWPAVERVVRLGEALADRVARMPG